MKTRTVEINVTQNDIKKGLRFSCRECPVARAMSRKIKPPYSLFVSLSKVSIIRESKERPFAQLELPEIAQDFIRRFDGYVKVAPFKFKIGFPVSVLR